MKKVFLNVLAIQATVLAHAQEADNGKNEALSFHFQSTIINQYKAGFSAKYSGANSLRTEEESKTSITATLFAGARLWKGAGVYCNTEIAGGGGLSNVLGLAAPTNGETFRIGDPAPKLYVARIFIQQIFNLGHSYAYQETDMNQLAGKIPDKYLSVTVGKIGVADYFDQNTFSHDPRTQFMNWALMDNGAWDYPANTRGYTPSVVAAYVSPEHELRYAFSLMPTEANGSIMNWNIAKAYSQNIEYTHRHKLSGKEGAVRLLAFYNSANMGNYKQSIAINPGRPVIEDSRKYGRSKYGFGVNAEQYLTNDLGCFLRAAWNDGQNETWAFAEIDRSLSAGFSLNGASWHRDKDNAGIAFAISGLSQPHCNYLAAGGYGFVLGDGKLNYTNEHLTECYYSANLFHNALFLTGGYQLIFNPGYNRDRKGPVNVLSVRLHASI